METIQNGDVLVPGPSGKWLLKWTESQVANLCNKIFTSRMPASSLTNGVTVLMAEYMVPVAESE